MKHGKHTHECSDCGRPWPCDPGPDGCRIHHRDMCPRCAREAYDRQRAEIQRLEKVLASRTGQCPECKGSGEFGLADGEVPCGVCGGSGDLSKPGIFKSVHVLGEHLSKRIVRERKERGEQLSGTQKGTES